MKKFEMKISKQARKESDMPMRDPEGPTYPYGLRISLDSAALEKLGMKTLPKVGAKMDIEAFGTVTSVSSNQRNGSSSKTVEIQIQKIGLEDSEPDDSMEDTARTAYRRLNSKK